MLLRAQPDLHTSPFQRITLAQAMPQSRVIAHLRFALFPPFPFFLVLLLLLLLFPLPLLQLVRPSLPPSSLPTHRNTHPLTHSPIHSPTILYSLGPSHPPPTRCSPTPMALRLCSLLPFLFFFSASGSLSHCHFSFLLFLLLLVLLLLPFPLLPLVRFASEAVVFLCCWWLLGWLLLGEGDGREESVVGGAFEPGLGPSCGARGHCTVDRCLVLCLTFSVFLLFLFFVFLVFYCIRSIFLHVHHALVFW